MTPAPPPSAPDAAARHPNRGWSLRRDEWALLAMGVVALGLVAASLVVLLGPGWQGHAGLVVSLHVGALLAITAALVQALTLLQRGAARLSQLTDVAAELGSGDLSVRASTSPLDAYGQLGLALNVMSERIGRLLQAQKDLLAGVSHELRSPLTRIEVALELLRGELERAAHGQGTTEGQQLLDEVGQEVALLERHIARLLEAQRVSADGALLQRRSLDFDGLVAAVLHRERHRLQQLDWHVDVDLRLGAAQLRGDDNALDRVVSTLVENAVRHAAEGVAEDGREVTRSLRVETVIAADRAVLRVMDRGCGLDAEARQRVFEPFFRGDRSRSQATGGTGLGLYLVKRISEAHGGSARVLPRQGGGLVVEVWLPLEAGDGGSKSTRRMGRVADVAGQAPD
jgi:two-component system OmpR family sensor kinase